MDDDLESFVEELSRLRPIAPSADLHRRLTRELAPRLPRTVVQWWVAAAALPIAATIAILFATTSRNTLSTSASRLGDAGHAAAQNIPAASLLLKPVAAENVLYAATDEGDVTLDNGTRVRRERLKFVDTITWQNPQTHASLTWNIPREEVRVDPVRYQ